MIYKEIKERFSDHLWLDVVSKCDLLQESPVVFTAEDSNDGHLEMARYHKMGPSGAIRVSVKSGEGLDEVTCSNSTFNFPLTGICDHPLCGFVLVLHHIPSEFELS